MKDKVKQYSFIIKSKEEILPLAQSLIDLFQYKIIVFTGDLGAGKTTIIKELVKLMGSTDSTSSPSFSIINQYQSPDGPIYHIDLYRMENIEEVFNLGIEELIYNAHISFIEWPQIFWEYLDEPYHHIHISVEENNHRKITLV